MELLLNSCNQYQFSGKKLQSVPFVVLLSRSYVLLDLSGRIHL